MLHRLLLVITIIISLSSSICHAQDSNSANSNQDSSSAENGLSETSIPTALRISVVNGAIDFINNSKRARIAWEWEWLPEHQDLIQEARANLVQPVTCTFKNEDLGKPELWDESLSSDCLDLLSDALKVDIRQGFDSTESIRNFKEFWIEPSGEGVKLVKNTSIKGNQYFGLVRDYSLLTSLLESGGINYSLEISEVQGTELQTEVPILSDQDISWKVKIYKFFPSTETSFYRFSITAQKEQADEIFFTSTEENVEIPLKVGVSLKNTKSTIGILNNNFPNLNTSVSLKNAVNNQLKPLEEKKAPTELETILSILGNINVPQIVSNNFLGGTKNSTVILGGLISEEQLTPIAGANLEFAKLGDARGGFLFGVGTGDDTPLFLGPSFQYSIFTLSAGASLFEENDSLEVEPAGVISLDLSKLLGGREEVTKLALDSSQSGGNWGKASDLIASNLTLVYLSLQPIAEINKTFTLRLTTDCEGKEITDISQQAVLEYNTSKELKEQLTFIPRGKYKYKGIEDQGFALRNDGALISESRTVDFCRSAFSFPIEWQVEKQ